MFGVKFDKVELGAVYSFRGRSGEPDRQIRIVAIDRDAGRLVYEDLASGRQMQRGARCWNDYATRYTRVDGASQDNPVPAAPALAPAAVSNRREAPSNQAELLNRLDALIELSRESKDYLADVLHALRGRGVE